MIMYTFVFQLVRDGFFFSLLFKTQLRQNGQEEVLYETVTQRREPIQHNPL